MCDVATQSCRPDTILASAEYIHFSRCQGLSDTFITVDTDILKPDTGYLTIIERPTQSASGPSSKGTTEPQSSSGSRSPPYVVDYTEPVSEGEEDEILNAPARDEDKRIGVSGEDVRAAIAHREQMLKERRESDVRGDAPALDNTSVAYLNQKRASNGSQGKPRALSIDPLALSSKFDATLITRLRGEHESRERGKAQANDDSALAEDPEEEYNDELPGDDRILSRDWAAPAGKKIAIPVRIEPKVYFAAERTFLVGCLYFLYTYLHTIFRYSIGLIMQFLLERSPQRFLTSCLLMIHEALLALHSSPLRPCLLLLILSAFLSTAPTGYENDAQKDYTTTNMAPPCYVLYCS